jgi:glutathione S-transferase
MSKVRIHGVPPSTFTRTVLLACREKGIDYELVEARPDTVAPLNPFRKIPAMTHDGFTLYESIAILRYFERVFPGARLWPDDARGAALTDQWAGAVSDSLVNAALRYMAARFGFLPVPAEMAQKYLDKTRELLPIFDRRLGESRFLAGDGLTAADLYLAPILFYFADIPELKALLDAAPNCGRFVREMAARPSVQATEPPWKPQLAA